MKKIAVTGAGGYVGRHVVRALAGRNDIEVVACFRNPEQAVDLPVGVKCAKLDITEPDDAYDRIGRPDAMIHLAWAGLPNYRSLHHFESELPAQYGFLRSLVEQGLSAMLVTGTCYEYGMLSGELHEEMESPPTNPYGFAKASLRRQLRFLQQDHSFSLTWTRLFYSYGEGQAPSSIYSQLRAAVARGDASFTMSKGEQLRDFLPIETVAQHLAELAVDTPDTDVNVCSGQPVSIRGLVEAWQARHGWNLPLELGIYPYPTYEPLAFWGSRARLEKLVGADN